MTDILILVAGAAGTIGSEPFAQLVQGGHRDDFIPKVRRVPIHLGAWRGHE